MDTPTAVATIFGVLAVCGTIVGCTWNLSGKLGSMGTALKGVQKRQEITHELLVAHTADCDIHRATLDTTLKEQGVRLTKVEANP